MTESLGIRFLVVDDEESIRRLCTTVAGSLGFTCMEAVNGHAALALLEDHSINLIHTIVFVGHFAFPIRFRFCNS